MPDWTGGGADKGEASTNTAEETTTATEADTTTEGTAAGEELAEPDSE
ncbi:hypothetical protein AB0L75_25025 [Streptomyces sp. NPDC052101]